MTDTIYTTPIYLTGDMVASISGQPTNQGNRGDANFGMVMHNVQAMGGSDALYRLVWTGNQNTRAVEFGNGQFWQLQVYDASGDTDGDPMAGGNGWSAVTGYSNLTPKNDLVSGLGDGDDYIVFEGSNGYLLFNVNGGLPSQPTTLTYLAGNQNGDPTAGDNDGHLDFYDAYHAINATCFCAGTMIETATGPRPIETLAAGDLVRTLDHGLQPLRWIGNRVLDPVALLVAPQLRPVQIAAGALGPNQPAQDLRVSPQHRLLVRSAIAERISGAREVLVAAKHLVGLPGITVLETAEPVQYLHLLFDRHEVIFANGTQTELLYTGAQALRGLSRAARSEVLAIFPELRSRMPIAPAARPLLSGRIGRKLSARHAKNGQPMVMAS